MNYKSWTKRIYIYFKEGNKFTLNYKINQDLSFQKDLILQWVLSTTEKPENLSFNYLRLQKNLRSSPIREKKPLLFPNICSNIENSILISHVSIFNKHQYSIINAIIEDLITQTLMMTVQREILCNLKTSRNLHKQARN